MYDVIGHFHQRNRAPRPPDPKCLQAIRQRAWMPVHDDGSDDEGSENDSDTGPAAQTRAARHSQQVYSSTTDNPKQLHFYPPFWRGILSDSKDYTRAWMATECGFPNPSNPDHRNAVVGCI